MGTYITQGNIKYRGLKIKELTLLSYIAVGLISTAAIAGSPPGPVGKTVGGAAGAGVGAGIGAAEGALAAPAKGLKSASKCVDKTGLPILCTAAGAIDTVATVASPVGGTLKGTSEGAAAGSGN